VKGSRVAAAYCFRGTPRTVLGGRGSGSWSCERRKGHVQFLRVMSDSAPCSQEPSCLFELLFVLQWQVTTTQELYYAIDRHRRKIKNGDEVLARLFLFGLALPLYSRRCKMPLGKSPSNISLREVSYVQVQHVHLVLLHKFKSIPLLRTTCFKTAT
jgi:hypothetical protein